MDAATALPAAAEPAQPVISPQKRAQMEKASKDYEAVFLSQMLATMMPDTSSTQKGGFGGGEGEAAFKSFMTDAMARSMVKHGGIGLAPKLNAALLKLQGAS